MAQGEKYDSVIIERLKLGQLEIDDETGTIFSYTKGNKKQIGYYDKVGSYVFSSQTKDNKTFKYWICRCVYLCNNDYYIPKGFKVSHIDADVKNNCIFNLKLEKVKPYVHPARWRDSEIQLLKNNIDLSYEKLHKILPNRSIKAIRHKVALAKLPKKNIIKKKWTKKDDIKLKKLYLNPHKTVKEIAKILERTPSSISLRARKLDVNRNAKVLKNCFNHNRFYQSLKLSKIRGTTGLECCICGYNKHIDLHHIDGNNKNHNISNIASLCPNHHREVEAGEHKDVQVFSIWWRISGKTPGKKFNNKKEIKNEKLEKRY